jgi:hypothetical protein
MPTNALKLPAALEKFVASHVREGTYRNREAAIVAPALAEFDNMYDYVVRDTRTMPIWFSIASVPASLRSSA